MHVREVEAKGLTFSVRETGEGGEPVVLLHGFPETSFMWRGLMATLADAGYHCVAPDQRGYSPGARPEGAEAYNYQEVGSDVHAIAKAVGLDRFHLVGHDWGAGAGWCALAIDESPIQSWTAMSVPHYAGFAPAVRDDPDEELYRGLLATFVDPNTPELMSADDAAGIKLAWSESSPEEVEAYASVFSDVSAMRGALDWYVASRSHDRFFDDPAWFRPVSVPTLLLWGRNDAYIRPMSLKLAEEHMTGPYRVVELDAGHWLIQERPEQVTEEILAHLRENAL